MILYVGDCEKCQERMSRHTDGTIEGACTCQKPDVRHWALTDEAKEIYCKVCQTCRVRVWLAQGGKWHHVNTEEAAGPEIDEEHEPIPITPDPDFLEEE